MALAVFFSFVSAGPAFAWWNYGHQTIGEIAMANVTPDTRAAVRNLLAREALLDTPTCPVGTIREAAIWADCVKSLGDRFSYTSTWHYQDFEACKPFSIKDACPGGNCLSRQVERQARLLKNKDIPTRERLTALLFLIHFAGDLTQPLHNAVHEEDYAGNRTRTAYGIVHGNRVNLHLITDGYLAERAISTPPALVRAYSAPEKARLTQGTVADWARESWEVARDSIYPAALGANYCADPSLKQGTLDEDEIEALIPVMRDEVVKGGLRLAKLLDEAFASP